MSYSRTQLVNWLKPINIEGKKVLDLGCGPEEYWADKFVKGTPEVFDTLDINDEFNPTFVEDLNNKFYGQELDRRYDIIFALETFEHLWNPVVALDNIASWLKEGGTFYFSAPFFNPPHDVVDYLRITDEWWIKVLTAFRFTNIEIEPRVAEKGLEDLLSFYKKEGMRMSKLRLKRGEAEKIKHVGYMGKAVL